jgi:hypothetical protein
VLCAGEALATSGVLQGACPHIKTSGRLRHATIAAHGGMHYCTVRSTTACLPRMCMGALRRATACGGVETMTAQTSCRSLVQCTRTWARDGSAYGLLGRLMWRTPAQWDKGTIVLYGQDKPQPPSMHMWLHAKIANRQPYLAAIPLFAQERSFSAVMCPNVAGKTRRSCEDRLAVL